MANAVYSKYMEAVIQASSNSSLGGTVKVGLGDTGDVAFNSAHDFYDDISARTVGTPQTIGSKTYTNGLFDGADVTFSSVSGDPCECLDIYIDTGTPGTSRLVAFFDTGVTGLPVTPNGGNIGVTFNAGGIIQF